LIINIDLDEDLIKQVDEQAEKEERSRRKMIELIVKRSFK